MRRAALILAAVSLAGFSGMAISACRDKVPRANEPGRVPITEIPMGVSTPTAETPLADEPSRD